MFTWISYMSLRKWVVTTIFCSQWMRSQTLLSEFQSPPSRQPNSLKSQMSLLVCITYVDTLFHILHQIMKFTYVMRWKINSVHARFPSQLLQLDCTRKSRNEAYKLSIASKQQLKHLLEAEAYITVIRLCNIIPTSNTGTLTPYEKKKSQGSQIMLLARS